MARRFVLVGLLSVIKPGTIVQIYLGTIACVVYLVVQLQVRPSCVSPRPHVLQVHRSLRVPYSQARPYHNDGDNFLALACSFSLLILLMCSVLYKYDSLVESEDIQLKMSREQKEDYNYSQGETHSPV